MQCNLENFDFPRNLNKNPFDCCSARLHPITELWDMVSYSCPLVKKVPSEDCAPCAAKSVSKCQNCVKLHKNIPRFYLFGICQIFWQLWYFDKLSGVLIDNDNKTSFNQSDNSLAQIWQDKLQIDRFGITEIYLRSDLTMCQNDEWSDSSGVIFSRSR